MNRIKKLFLDDRFILIVIMINTLTIFSEGFHDMPYEFVRFIYITDSLITFIFLVEAVVKIRYYGWKFYINSNWNKLDFILVILSLPSFLLIFSTKEHTDLSFLLVLRISRVFKFLRFFKFIPGIKDLALGVKRALKTSIVVLLGFLVYNIIVSVLSCSLFKDISPKYFGDPATSFYSTFKVFTVEGWYEIPDKMTTDMHGIKVFAIKAYFIFILITGGILGLSLVNSIFVDAMVSDNNDDLEEKIDELNKKIELLLEIEADFIMRKEETKDMKKED